MKDALDEVMSLSDRLSFLPCFRHRNNLTLFGRIIRELVGGVRSHIGALYKASEAVSLAWPHHSTIRSTVGLDRVT